MRTLALALMATILLVGCTATNPSKLAAREMTRQMMSERHDYEAGKDAVSLASDGKANYVIVASAESPAPVRFAALELKTFLDKMTGAKFEIVDAMPDHKRAIVLGDCPAARAVGIDASAIARDGYRIQYDAPTIYIVGKDDATEFSERLFWLNDPKEWGGNKDRVVRHWGGANWDFHRGTLYGAYRFLEELGVRWFMPTDFGTVVPKKPNLTVTAFALWDEPTFKFRRVGPEVWGKQTLGGRLKEMKKVGLDFSEYAKLKWIPRDNRLWLLRMRGHSEAFAFNHRPASAFWYPRFGKSHPEYFALLENGKRDVTPRKGHFGHLCYTNNGMYRETLADIHSFFSGKTAMSRGMPEKALKRYPDSKGWQPVAFYGRSVSLLPHDGFKRCTCAGCAKWAFPEADATSPNSDLVWQFVVDVAKWMETEHPGKFATCLAYASHSALPVKVKSFPDNLMVGLCLRGFARTEMIIPEKNYQRFMKIVRQWAAVNEMPLLFWNHHLTRFRRPAYVGVPMIVPHFWQRLFKDMASYGRAMVMQCNVDSVMLEQLNRYVMMRLLYNPNEDVDALIDDYALSYFGPKAGPMIRKMLTDVEARSMAAYGSGAGAIDMWEKHFTEDVLKGYRVTADAAVAETKGTEYEAHARLFADHFVGMMEHGFNRYVKKIRDIVRSGSATMKMHAVKGEIKLDGALDEAAWKASEVRPFLSNVDGEKTLLKNEVRFLHAPDSIYVAFRCEDPNTPKLGTKPGDVETVEVFIDTQYNNLNYYQILVDTEGRVYNWYHPGAGEPADSSWKSNVKVATKRYADHWIIEMRIPRAAMTDGTASPVDRPWGINFCRSYRNPPREKDTFTSFSPIMRGRFSQPYLFAQVFFGE
jgi:Domain of unknown function (DUF4838)/Carbohydrate family 9 binding domain-like